MSLRGIVFDFDGVIANSEPLHYLGFRDVAAERGATLTEADYYQRYLGFDDWGAFAAISGDQHLGWTDEEIGRMVERKAVRLEQLESERSVLFPGAAQAIRRLAAEGPLAIASGALRAEIVRILAREQLTQHFVTVVGAEDTPASKPAPDPYRLAVHRLATLRTGWSAPTSYVAIEDSHWGLESARAAGLKTVAVTHTYPADALTADLVVSNLDALSWSALEGLVQTV